MKGNDVDEGIFLGNFWGDGVDGLRFAQDAISAARFSRKSADRKIEFRSPRHGRFCALAWPRIAFLSLGRPSVPRHAQIER